MKNLPIYQTLQKLCLCLAFLCLLPSSARAEGETVETVAIDKDLFGLVEPYGVAVDAARNLYYFTDSANNRIMRYNATNGITTVVGSGYFDPRGLILARGGLVVADAGNHVIRFIPINGGAPSIIAGSLGSAGLVNGVGTAAKFNTPSGLAVDSAGNIYVADQLNHSIRRIAPNNTVDTIVAASSGLRRPSAVAVSDSSQIFIADTENNSIRMLSGGSLSTVASAVNPRGLLWVGGRTGLAVSHSGGNIVTGGELFAGSPLGTSGSADGPALSARFNTPMGLGIDADSSLIVADLKNNVLRKIKRRVPIEAELPKLFPAGITNVNAISVTNRSPLAEVVFRYTLDGTDPTFLSDSVPQVGGESILVLERGSITNRSVTLKVRSFSPDTAPSPVVSSVYTFLTATPSMTPFVAPPASFVTNTDLTITLANATAGARMRYTVDGTDPVEADGQFKGELYTVPFLLGTNSVVKVRAFKEGYLDSPVVSATYIFTNATPVVDPNRGALTNDVLVKIQSATTNASFHYTLDGSEPTTASSKYDASAQLRLSGNSSPTNIVLKVKGFKPGYTDSLIVTNEYNFTVGNIALTHNSTSDIRQVLENEVLVKLATGTTNAQIKYTTDGTTPTPLAGTDTGTNQTDLFFPGDGTLVAKAFRLNFIDSLAVTQKFQFRVGKPVIAPVGGSNVTVELNNDVKFSLSSATASPILLYTTNSTEPSIVDGVTNGIVYGEPFFPGNGTIIVRGFKAGFQPSLTNSLRVHFKVAKPTLTPAGGTTNFAGINVSFATITEGATLYFTLDDSEPTTSSFKYTSSFLLETNAVLKVRGFKPGYEPSDIATATYHLKVPTPVISPNGGITNGATTVTITDSLTGSSIHYLLGAIGDSSEPGTNSPVFNPSTPIVIRSNTVVRARAFYKGFSPSEIAVAAFTNQLDKPVLNPAYGYFPDGTGVTLSVSNSAARIYYRLDGEVPTTNDSFVLPGESVPFNYITANTRRDLSFLTARAFIPAGAANWVQESEIARGRFSSESAYPTNELRVSRDLFAGIGSKAVVPVIGMMQSTQQLRSLQFKVYLYPASNTVPNLALPFQGLSTFPTNDFVPLGLGTGDGSGNPVIGRARDFDLPAGTNGIVTNVYEQVYVGNGTSFGLNGAGNVANLGIRLAATAKEGDEYWIEVVEPSGTSDGRDTPVALVPGPKRKITVKNIPYIVGDTARGWFYNAGDFGSGNLNNNDVNNAFYAALGSFLPYEFSDAFDAMDAFPVDTSEAVGGDGQIRLLDWNTILQRSLRNDLENWRRVWTNGGFRVSATTNLSRTPNLPAQIISAAAGASLAWSREGALKAGVVENVQPGQTVSVPVYVNMKQDRQISGLQFRVTADASEGAPDLTKKVEFTPLAGLRTPITAPNLSLNELGCGWPVGDFVQPISGTGQLLGHIKVTVPENAQPGQCYNIHFSHVDGAPDLNTQYNLESFPGCVWVKSEAKEAAAVLSDEWKLNFFGTLSDSSASPGADPDGDGQSNLAEFQAGTSPASLKLQLATSEWRSGNLNEFKLRWYGALGKTYIVEASSDLKNWSQIGTFTGSGATREIAATRSNAARLYYRVRQAN